MCVGISENSENLKGMIVDVHSLRYFVLAGTHLPLCSHGWFWQASATSQRSPLQPGGPVLQGALREGRGGIVTEFLRSRCSSTSEALLA